METRLATPGDAAAIASIYNQGIEDRIATFETRSRSEADIRAWFEDTAHPIVVVTEGDRIIAYATTSLYRPRECYAGIAEFGVYVAREWRGKGAGRAAMLALFREAESRGYWKLVSRIFVENKASRALMQSVGFREVGVYEKHGQLEGVWHDCVIVEKLLAPAQA